MSPPAKRRVHPLTWALLVALVAPALASTVVVIRTTPSGPRLTRYVPAR